MAFDIRCPECRAKLRLDEAPDSDTPIECPRCGSTFSAPEPDAPARAPKARKGGDAKAPADGEKKKKSGTLRKRKAKKKTTNPVVLLIAIGFGFAGLIAVGFLMVWFLGRAGRVEEMLTFVPGDCNWARGVNVAQLRPYEHGYGNEVKKFFTPEVKSATDEVAKAAGHDADTFVSYLVVAKNKPDRGATGTMYVVRTERSLPPDIGSRLTGATEQPTGGGTSYRMPARAPGVLAGSVVHFPTPRHVVIIPPGPMQGQMVNASVAGKSSPGESFAGKLDATGRTVMRGSMWLIVRADGGLRNYIGGTTSVVDKDFKPVHDRALKSKTFGVWTTPGGTGVRIGVAMQCDDPKDAAALADMMKEGPLGKGDESEPTNQLKQAIGSLTGNKKLWTEFTQYLKFRTRGECAYLTSDITGENAVAMMNIVNNPVMGTGAPDPSQGGFGPPGGPQGGPAQPGLPGGVVTPGMGP